MKHLPKKVVKNLMNIKLPKREMRHTRIVTSPLTIFQLIDQLLTTSLPLGLKPTETPPKIRGPRFPQFRPNIKLVL